MLIFVFARFLSIFLFFSHSHVFILFFMLVRLFLIFGLNELNAGLFLFSKTKKLIYIFALAKQN